MLFITLERNSDLLFGALRFLNVLHRLQPKLPFVYHSSSSPVQGLRFESAADSFAGNWLITLYACCESPFNGARPEALAFFRNVVQTDFIANEMLVDIVNTWPWTNRNKYYFLSILFDVHGFERLLRRIEAQSGDALQRDELLRGMMLSLQYRNLISPGQTLAISLTRQAVPGMFAQLAHTLRDGPRFEALNCLNHWMRCVDGKDRVFELLELGSDDLLSPERFAYLHASNFERLVLFRACFKREFANAPLIDRIDAIVNERQLVRTASSCTGGDIVAILAQLDVVIANTIAQPADIVRNLSLIGAFMRFTAHEDSTPLRENTLKLVPNLLYLLAPMLRHPNVEPHVRAFFRTLRTDIFEAGLADAEQRYQPVVFATRLYAMLLKTLYGSRSDRIIKRFSAEVNAKIVQFLGEQDTWPLLGDANYARLFALLRSEFDDVRDITCELLVRFYPANDIREQCETALRHTDVHQCGRGRLLARVAIGFVNGGANANDAEGGRFYCALGAQVRAAFADYGEDPLRRVREPGGHLFGGLDAMNEFHSATKCSALDGPGDVRLCEHIVRVIIGYLQTGSACTDDRPADGSASFERMDENLGALVQRSSYRSDGADVDQLKQALLKSLWTTLRAACDLVATIGVRLLDDVALVERCYAVCVSVLLHCRHKGAIEAAGLSLARLVRAITARYTGDSPAYGILLHSIERVFAIVDKTNTTRRGAGLSIMVHQLVRSERCPQRPLLVAVMRTLFALHNEREEGNAASETGQNRDNRLAAVLHFLGTLVQDGELRNHVTFPYAAEIFALAMATIESTEWTIRNAALQLVGAFVPKLVGQAQFFTNTLDWQPVYMTYCDLRIKMPALLGHIVSMLRQCRGPSVPLVTVLELMSRIEVTHGDNVGDEFCMLFYRFLQFPADKVRTLAARCLARFYACAEIPAFVLGHIGRWRQLRSANAQHGCVRAMEFMLLKWASDTRCMPVLQQLHRDGIMQTLFEEVRIGLLRVWCAEDAVQNYFVRCYVFDLMRLVGCERREAALLPASCAVDVEAEVVRLRLVDGRQVGFEAWADKVCGCSRGKLGVELNVTETYS